MAQNKPSSFASTQALLDFDKQHIWHPYSGFIDQAPVFAVASARGVYLQLEDGREVIDAMSSWWSAIHGYNHPQLNAALHKQIDAMSHVMFGGLTHRPACELAERLINITPAGLERVFFSDSGSVAVEVAIKMAIQYWASRGLESKQRLLTVRGGYHGDTIGAMSVCDPVTGMHGLFQQVLSAQIFVERPSCGFHEDWDPTALDALATALEVHKNEIAAVIIEPIVQGAGGMRFYHPHYLRDLKQLCADAQVLLIFDEIATGFGRSGELFAADHARLSPDIMCVGKALTGGTMSLAATLTSAKVAETISSGDPGVFMHGPTFMANPLACAVASASIDVLLASPWRDTVRRIETQLKRQLAPLADLPSVHDVRILGAIGVVEMNEPVDMHTWPARFIEHGVWLRPFGRLVYTMPPFIISNAEIDTIASAIEALAKA